jgi:BMFP domain-containing protein YqiC
VSSSGEDIDGKPGDADKRFNASGNQVESCTQSARDCEDVEKILREVCHAQFTRLDTVDPPLITDLAAFKKILISTEAMGLP